MNDRDSAFTKVEDTCKHCGATTQRKELKEHAGQVWYKRCYSCAWNEYKHEKQIRERANGYAR